MFSSSKTLSPASDAAVPPAKPGPLSRMIDGGKAKLRTAKKGPKTVFDSFAEQPKRDPALTAATIPVPVEDAPAAARRSPRVVPVKADTTLLDNKGKRHRARIINFSASGVAIDANFDQVAPDTITHVGSSRVSAGRSMRIGAVFLFQKPLAASRCHPHTVL